MYINQDLQGGFNVEVDGRSHNKQLDHINKYNLTKCFNNLNCNVIYFGLTFQLQIDLLIVIISRKFNLYEIKVCILFFLIYYFVYIATPINHYIFEIELRFYFCNKKKKKDKP